jgi:hypothetical protein
VISPEPPPGPARSSVTDPGDDAVVDGVPEVDGAIVVRTVEPGDAEVGGATVDGEVDVDAVPVVLTTTDDDVGDGLLLSLLHAPIAPAVTRMASAIRMLRLAGAGPVLRSARPVRTG